MSLLMQVGVAGGALLAAPFLSRALCRRLGLVKPNFRGERIPASVGVTFLIVTAAVYGALVLAGDGVPDPLRTRAPLFLLVAAGFGLLGLLDDLWGSRAVGGFRGHLRALFTGRPTTGSVKLVGGGLLALAAGAMLRGPRPEALLDAALVALSANALNLLDLRPGRALFGFALLALPSLIAAAVSGGGAGVLLLVAVAAALVEWPFDTRGHAMMGDTGSNLLGAVAGLAAAVALPPVGRAVLLLLLAGVNVLSERVSITRLIARTPWLAAIDRRLGVR